VAPVVAVGGARVVRCCSLHCLVWDEIRPSTLVTSFPPPKRNIPANSARFFPPYSLHPHSSSSISPHYPNYQNLGPTRHTLTLFSPPPPLLSLPISFLPRPRTLRPACCDAPGF
jgi:hypothetical protein